MSQKLEIRDLILGGLRFAENGEFLEAIDLWEEALAFDSSGSTEAAYLCIALLEDHLRALHEGDEAEFPDFREQLREIGFGDLDEHPTEPVGSRMRTKTPRMAAAVQGDPSEFGKQPRYAAVAPPPPAHRPTLLTEAASPEDDDSDRWDVPSPPLSEMEISDEQWATFTDDKEPSGNTLQSIPSELDDSVEEDSIELELPNPIQAHGIRLGQILPIQIAASALERSPNQPQPVADPRSDPFEILRDLDDSVPELPPPVDSSLGPDEKPLSLDLERIDSYEEEPSASDSGGGDFEIVIDDSAGFDQARLNPWERADESEVLDLGEKDILPDTGTHDWGQGTPWSTAEGGNAGFNASPVRKRLKASHTADREFDELDLPEDPTGQLEDEVLKEALTHHSLGDYHSSQSLIEEHLKGFPNDPRLDDLRKENLRQIEMKYLAKIGSLEARPVVAISADQLVWHNLNQNKGFVLSRVDGKLTVADIVEIVHLSRHETLRLLSELVSDGIIHFP